jgi:hypothetical protein
MFNVGKLFWFQAEKSYGGIQTSAPTRLSMNKHHKEDGYTFITSETQISYLCSLLLKYT